MKKRILSIIVALLCFWFYGCGDEGILLDDLLVPAAPSANLPAIGPVPIEIQEIIWGKDIPTLMLELEDAIDGSYTNDKGQTVRDLDRIRARRLINKICLRREQEAYYTKYISAGGVAIMGHTSVDDRMFYAARDIVLGMTQKRPELRALLTPLRENRPGALIHDGVNDVTGLGVPSRTFRYILYHPNMGSTSIPEKHLSGGLSPPQWTPAGPVGHCFVRYCLQSVEMWNKNWGKDLPPKWEARITGTFCHEFAHAIHYAIRLINPTFEDRLRAAYAEAVKNASSVNNPDGKGYWVSGSYALSNPGEFWAETVSEWFTYFSKVERQLNRFREGNPLAYALLEEWFDLIYLREVESRY